MYIKKKEAAAWKCHLFLHHRKTFDLILHNNEEDCSPNIYLAYDSLKYQELKQKKA